MAHQLKLVSSMLYIQLEVAFVTVNIAIDFLGLAGPVSPRIMSAEMDHSSSDVIMTMHNEVIQSEDKCIFISNK